MEEEKEITRRLVRVVIDPYIIRQMVIEGKEFHQKCIEGLPENAEWVGEYFDEQAFRVCFIFRHESFEPVPHGEVLPMRYVVCQTLPNIACSGLEAGASEDDDESGASH